MPITEPGSAGALGLTDATSKTGLLARSWPETTAQTDQAMKRTPTAVRMRESYAHLSVMAIDPV